MFFDVHFPWQQNTRLQVLIIPSLEEVRSKNLSWEAVPCETRNKEKRDGSQIPRGCVFCLKRLGMILMQPDVRSRYDFWFYTVVQRDTCIACMLILAFNFQVSTASEFADHTLGGHVTPHNPIRIQCQVHGKVFQFQVFYQSKTTSATGKVSLPAEKLASSSHLMMNHLLERFPTCQVMCFHPLPQPPMDAVLKATENNKWRDGCQSYRKSGIFYHLGFWIGFFLLYYLCYLYRGVTVSITTYISLNLYIYIYVHR